MSEEEYLLTWDSSTNFFGGHETHNLFFKSLEEAKKYRKEWSGHSNGKIYKVEIIEE